MWRAVPAVLLVLVAACSGGLPDGLKVSGGFGHQPTVTIPGSGPGGKLEVVTLHEGKGAKVAAGDLVAADYVGYRWNGTDHKLIASSYDSGRPAMFPYGHLVPGLNRALSGQRVGGRVMAVIPPGQGYGANGYAAMQIGGSDSLVFVLDVLATYPNASGPHGAPQPQTEAGLPKVSTAATPSLTIPHTRPPARLQVRTIVKGTGKPVEPRQLVDEAFLRRIPYKIHAVDPTEAEFRQMIHIFAPRLGFEAVDADAVDYLINTHYKRAKRPFRCCQPRDLLLQVRNYCVYNDLPLVMKPEYFDFAVKNYFTVM